MPEVASIVSVSVMLGTLPLLTDGVSVNVNSLFCSIAALGPFLTTSMTFAGGFGELLGCREQMRQKHIGASRCVCFSHSMSRRLSACRKE
jgi:hypothetical protein